MRRKLDYSTICNIFLFEKDKFRHVCEHELDMTYLDDTRKDVNGDRYNDFLVHWYPSSGCCLRDVYNVYLYQPESGRFTDDFELINPTFSSVEKVVRGIGYGHPGEAKLYKLRWNEFQLDTIEFVYPYPRKKGTFIKTKTTGRVPTEKDGVLLTSLPQEYRTIKNISWVLDTL